MPALSGWCTPRARRTLIDKLGVTSFNVAITGHSVTQDGDSQQPVIARQAELTCISQMLAVPNALNSSLVVLQDCEPRLTQQPGL